jgi:hypothetical protein
MNRRVHWRIVVAVLIACGSIGYWLMIDRPATRSYQVYVALDRKGPRGLTDPPWDGPDAVVLYRTGREGAVCFDAFHSKDLHDRLAAKNGQLVTVEYDTFSDFGKVRGYNVHSVDGMMLANGYHVLREDFAATAGVVGSRRGDGTVSGGMSDCW